MNYFIDINLKPDAELSSPILMNAICAKLHKMFCDLKSTSIGISFPRYEVTLGNVLRIHGNEADLKKLQGMNWLGGMSGYCKLGDVLPVPAHAKHRIVSRKQASMSQSKLTRLLKRGSIEEQQVKVFGLTKRNGG